MNTLEDFYHLIFKAVRIICYCSSKWSIACKYILHITELQNRWGWKRLLEIVLSNPPTKAGTPRAGYTGLHPGEFRISPEKQAPQSL